MYAFDPFVRSDKATAKQLVDDITMGTLVSMGSADADASPLPFRFHTDEETGQSRLEGHMDRRNPLWQSLEKNKQALVIFWGPNCYISPSRYVTSPRVPTWLYVTLHIHGNVVVKHESDWLSNHLFDLAAHLEPVNSGWDLSKVGPYKNRLIGDIVGVSIEISKMTAQLKLAQQNTQEDLKKLYEALQSGSKEDQLIAEQMRQFNMAPDHGGHT